MLPRDLHSITLKTTYLQQHHGGLDVFGLKWKKIPFGQSIFGNITTNRIRIIGNLGYTAYVCSCVCPNSSNL